ncbi:hypothetical protein WN990_15995 [Kitasatospora purpeofusca]|uniref:hypothetical protein n=1 Tax=Kitasatospora purpeofusca TaxID=67352 RepID=UPI0030F1CD29
MTAEELSDRTENLKEIAAALANSLLDATEQAASGRSVARDLGNRSSEYQDARDLLCHHLTESGQPWAPAAEFADLDRAIALITRAAEDARAREARILDLCTHTPLTLNAADIVITAGTMKALASRAFSAHPTSPRTP